MFIKKKKEEHKMTFFIKLITMIVVAFVIGFDIGIIIYITQPDNPLAFPDLLEILFSSIFLTLVCFILIIVAITTSYCDDRDDQEIDYRDSITSDDSISIHSITIDPPVPEQQKE